jgi:hypothetical protein
MKKVLIKPLYALAVLCVVLLSCNRAENGKVGPAKHLTQTSDYYGDISVANGMLVFPNMETVVNVLNQLDADVNAHVGAFLEEWGHLSQEELEMKIEELNFNEDQPFEDLEDHFTFASLRKKIVADEAAWLENTPGEDIDSDPDNHFVIEDNERAILTERCEIQIGNTIYIMNPNGNGQTFAFSDGSLETLASFREGNDISNDPGVEVIGTDDAFRVDCRSSQAKRGYQTSGNRRIKWVVAHKTPIWGRNVVAKTKNYKKKSNGKWDKYSTTCQARVYGHISGASGNCTDQVEFNTVSGPYAEKNAKKVKHRVSVQTKTSNGWVKGYHYGAEGVSYTSTLSW